jgi:hypothetical protein
MQSRVGVCVVTLNNLTFVVKKGGEYCKEVKQSFFSLDPPSEPSSVVVVKRKYSSLTRDSNHKKRVTWFLLFFRPSLIAFFLLSCSAPVWSTYMFGIAMNICIGRVTAYIFDNCNVHHWSG